MFKNSIFGRFSLSAAGIPFPFYFPHNLSQAVSIFRDGDSRTTMIDSTIKLADTSTRLTYRAEILALL